MRRVHAILVIVALLATPMALLARADCGESTCDCMCKMVQKSLAANAQRQRAKLCDVSGTSSEQPMCAMNSHHHPPDFGLNAMMAPTAPSLLVVLLVPDTARPISPRQNASSASGFLSAPFQPPRS